MQTKSTSLLLCVAVTAVWLVIAIFGMSKHELWLDEAQHWLLAKDSASMGEMFCNMRYDGHAPLWNVLLFFASRVTGSFVAMQALHLLFATGTVFLILRFAPFPLWIKLILPFTYFFGFEYVIISRNYAPAIFFILLVCIHMRKESKQVLVVSLLSGIAVLFHSYAGFLLLPLLVYWYRGLRRQNVENSKFMLPGIIFGVMVIVSAWISMVPSDHFIFTLHSPVFAAEHFGSTLLLPFTGLMHFPEVTGDHWWNTNLFLPESNIGKAMIALVFWGLPAFVLRKNKPLFFVYLAGAIIISAGIFFNPLGASVRHSGMIAVLFLVCLWLGSERLSFGKADRVIVGLILMVQLGSWLTSWIFEWRKPFSQSENVATYVKANYPEMKVVVYPHWVGPAVSVYLGHRVFYAEREREGTFTNWESYRFTASKEEFIGACRDYMREQKIDSMVLLVNATYSLYYPPEGTATEIAIFDGAAVVAENYKVYLLKSQ